MSASTITATSTDAETDSPAGSADRRRRWILRLLGTLTSVIVLTFAAWLRLPEVSRGTVWAEDAAVFLKETISIGALQSIPEPYSGYLHVIPRALSGLAYTLAPIDSYAHAMSLLSCAAVAAIAVSVFYLSRSVIPQVPLRLMLAAIPVFLPVAPLEVLGNAANLHWYLLWLSPWLLLHQAERWYGKATLFVVALAVACSEIITGLFLPLALWTIIRRKNYWASSGLILGVGLQILVTASKPRYTTVAPQGDAVEPLSVVYGFVLQAIGSMWETDRRTVASSVVNFGGFAMIVPVTIVLGLLAYVILRGSLKWKAMAAYAFGAAAACWTAAIIVNAQASFNYAAFTMDDWLGQFGFFRYAAAPSMFLLALVPLAFGVAIERSREGSLRVGFLAPAIMLMFLLVNYFPATTTREAGPEWRMGVEAARDACAADPALVAATVHAAPTDWRADIPCAILLKP